MLSVSGLNLQVDYLQSYIQVIGLYGRGPGLAPPRSRAPIATLAATCRGIVATPPVLCSQREGQEVKSGLQSTALGLPFLLRFELLAEDRSNFTLHKCPRNGRICQRAFISTWTVHLRTKEIIINLRTPFEGCQRNRPEESNR